MDDDAITRLRQVIGKLSRRLNVTATSEGLTPSQASTLSLVATKGPLGIQQLVDLEGVNPTMMSRVVGKLDDAGLIRRVQNPADLRSASVEITRDGAATHARIKAQRAAVVSECVSRLPSDQADALAGALPALEALAAELQQLNR